MEVEKMYPQHTNPNPTRPDRVACAPYNFVPLPEKVVVLEPGTLPGHDCYDPERYTGYIECELVTRSPLYIRCALNPDFFRKWGETPWHELPEEKKKEKAQFFHIENAFSPCIPGSSLRGMVRSLVEIVSYGKVQWVSEESLVFRAVGDTSSLGKLYRSRFMKEISKDQFNFLVKAGYLTKKGEKWFITPAQEVEGITFGRIELNDIPEGLQKWNDSPNAEIIYVKLEPIKTHFHNKEKHPVKLNYAKVKRASNKPEQGLQEMILVKSGSMPKKHLGFVFALPDRNEEDIPIPEEKVMAYRNQVTQFQESLLGKDGVLRENQPVFYLLENGELLFFGHTMMFRLPYPNSVKDFIPEPLKFCPNPDLAEAIFGFVPDEQRKKGRSGRVYFTDAKFVAAREGIFYSDEPLIPKILASPKPTCFQHYLVQDKNKGHDPDLKATLAHYGTPSPSETVIRGHKLYWHKNNVKPPEIINDKDVGESQLTLIRPVKAGVTFNFRVYFENLNDFELGALLWVLNLPENCCHKLGMGKPLGMGAVRIKPLLFISNREERYRRLFTENHEWYEPAERIGDFRRFTQAFESFMLERLAEGAEGAGETGNFSDQTRIKMLLKMLQWPGPPKKLTRYMEIEGPRGNEFKNRPVLPDPLCVTESSSFSSAKTQKKNKDLSGIEKISSQTAFSGVPGCGTAMAEAFEKARRKRKPGSSLKDF
ncbi:MAG: TIGR03986 family type III CRISPR-associated RAMP protein [Desulfotomaculales bacterium]